MAVVVPPLLKVSLTLRVKYVRIHSSPMSPGISPKSSSNSEWTIIKCSGISMAQFVGKKAAIRCLTLSGPNLVSLQAWGKHEGSNRIKAKWSARGDRDPFLYPAAGYLLKIEPVPNAQPINRSWQGNDSLTSFESRIRWLRLGNIGCCMKPGEFSIVVDEEIREGIEGLFPLLMSRCLDGGLIQITEWSVYSSWPNISNKTRRVVCVTWQGS
jgi:hypothetical protein